jgi:Kef-type K+ transport system membrane component KefB
MPVFLELSALLGLTTIVTLLVRWLRQPLIIGYIISGVIVGPYVLNLLHSKDEFELFSKVGIVLLLFIMGLHLNPKVIREVGKVSLMAGVGQVLITTIVGFCIALLLGLSKVAALYVGIALTFSSTIIILKLLSDKKDLQKFYAKIAIGLLLVQDIIASIILILIAMVGSQGNTDALTATSQIVFKGAALMVGLMLLGTYIVPKVIKYIAVSQELLFIFSLAWGMGMASLFLWFGFSVEIGALVAGVTLSTTPYADEIASRMRPLRDFFIVIFFILLGSHLEIGNLGAIVIPALIFSVFVLVGNPIILIILMNLLGYSRRTSFMSALTVAQISEFSLIVATLGMQMGHLSQQTLSLITLVGIITITISSYLILYADKIYPKLSNVLGWLELLKNNKKERGNDTQFSAVLFGYDRVGEDFIDVFTKLSEPFCVVDFNPTSIEKLEKNKVPYYYGDASDVEFLEDLPFGKVKIAVSTIPDLNINRLLVHFIKGMNQHAIIVVLAHTAQDARQLYDVGASYVIMPHHLGAQHAAKLITKLGLDSTLFKEEKTKHLDLIIKRYLQY